METIRECNAFLNSSLVSFFCLPELRYWKFLKRIKNIACTCTSLRFYVKLVFVEFTLSMVSVFLIGLFVVLADC